MRVTVRQSLCRRMQWGEAVFGHREFLPTSSDRPRSWGGGPARSIPLLSRFLGTGFSSRSGYSPSTFCSQPRALSTIPSTSAAVSSFHVPALRPDSCPRGIVSGAPRLHRGALTACPPPSRSAILSALKTLPGGPEGWPQHDHGPIDAHARTEDGITPRASIQSLALRVN